MRATFLSAFSIGLLGAASAALAADPGYAPAPPAVDYVKICDAYGTGFWYIPGTETCLKIGGYAFGEYRVFGHDLAFTRWYGDSKGWKDRSFDGTGSHVRAALQFDARTNTEFGLLRSYIETWYTVDTQSGRSGAASTSLTLWNGFIQLGGLTAGHTSSFFDFYGGSTYWSYFAPAHSYSKLNLLAYTFAFGNGVTASISVEDPTTDNDFARRYGGPFFQPNGDLAANGTYGGLRLPDLVGNVRVDQAWGSAQVMGALHQDIPLRGDKELGYAVGAGITVNTPWIAQGDNINFQAAFSRGAISYVTPDPFLGSDFLVPPSGSPRQTDAWSVVAGFTHYFNPKLLVAMTASYVELDYGVPGFDIQQYDIQALVEYTSVAGLTVGFEVEYKLIDGQKAPPRIRGVGCDYCDGLVGLMRVQRTF